MSIQDIAKRAVLALGFEERAGLTAFDSSLKANNASLLKSNGVLPAWVAGKDGFGGAIDFDGTGAYLEVADHASLTFGDGASDFVVSLGGWSGQTGTQDQQAGTYKHELGHNLGLRHGGEDHTQWKPNYLSIMNK